MDTLKQLEEQREKLTNKIITRRWDEIGKTDKELMLIEERIREIIQKLEEKTK